jgi:hypothetical protein
MKDEGGRMKTVGWDKRSASQRSLELLGFGLLTPTFYDASRVKSFRKVIPISFQHPVNPRQSVLAFIAICRFACLV